MDAYVSILFLIGGVILVVVLRLLFGRGRAWALKEFAKMNGYDINVVPIEEVLHKYISVVSSVQGVPEDIVSFQKNGDKFFIFNSVGSKNQLIKRACILETKENMRFHMLIVSYAKTTFAPKFFEKVLVKLITGKSGLKRIELFDESMSDRLMCFFNSDKDYG